MLATFPETQIVPTRVGRPSSLGDHSGATSDTDLVSLWLARQESAGTRREYGRDARLFLDYLREIGATLRSLTVQDVDTYITGIAGRPATVARRVGSLKALLSFAQRTGYTTYNVGSVFKTPRSLNQIAERILEEEEVMRMLVHCADLRDRALLRLLYVSGCRVSEATRLDWKHIHVRDNGSSVVTLHGKGNKTRHVLLTATVTSELSTLRGVADDEQPVFVSCRNRRLTNRDANRIVKKIALKASLVRKPSPHWMRHAHASHALERGAPIHLVQATLGHSSLSTTGRYLHARPEDGSARYLVA